MGGLPLASSFMRVVSLIVGLLLTAWTILAIVQVMLVPRGSRSLVVRTVNALVRGLAVAPLTLMRSYARRDRWLTGSAPISVLLSLIVYIVILILTLGLVVYGLTDLTLEQAMYQSGATLTTLGIVEPVNVPSALTTFLAAFLGLVVIAVFIGYLMAIYGAYSSRESQMARLELLAGAPAWGPQILARGHALNVPEAEAPDCSAWIDWISDTRMNTQVNPILADFRSTTNRQHWTISMLAVLDAAALRLSLAAPEADPEAVRLIGAGAVAAAVLRGRTDIHNWDVEKAVMDTVASGGDAASASDQVTLSAEDLDQGWSALRIVGYPLPDDLDAVGRRFLAIRSLYAPDLYALAQTLQAVPAPWSGPRKPHMPTLWPERASN